MITEHVFRFTSNPVLSQSLFTESYSKVQSYVQIFKLLLYSIMAAQGSLGVHVLDIYMYSLVRRMDLF